MKGGRATYGALRANLSTKKSHVYHGVTFGICTVEPSRMLQQRITHIQEYAFQEKGEVAKGPTKTRYMLNASSSNTAQEG